MTLEHRLDGPEGAPILVLSSSLGTTLELWEPQLPALTRAFRVLRYDHRGHGGSPAPPGPYTVAELAGDLLGLLDELGLERVSLCGLSLGGVVGMWLGANAPERLERLVLACTSARFGTPDMWRERAALIRAEGTEAVADATMERWFTPAFAAGQPELVARFRAMVAATSDEGYAGCCDALAEWDFREELGRVAVPTLVIGGRDDPASPPEDVQLLADRIPGARLELIDGAAHLANVSAPDTFSGAVFAHLLGTA